MIFIAFLAGGILGFFVAAICNAASDEDEKEGGKDTDL